MVVKIMKQVLTEITKRKLIAIVRGIDKDSILSLVTALQAGGISCIEVTFDQTSTQGIKQTAASISLLKENFGQEILLGAGTVLNIEQVALAKQAGAEFILAPNTDTAVIKHTKQLGMVAMPGAFTASEAVTAWNAGADIVKLFPVSQLGPAYIQALQAPLAHMRFAAVGGINETNASDFLKAGACCLGIGGNLVSKKLIAAKDFAEIERLARNYVQAITIAKQS